LNAREDSSHVPVPLSDAVAAITGSHVATDRAARLERLYRAHSGRVFGVCLRMTGDRERATELTQDVFVRAWEKLDLLRDETEAGAWFGRMATNVVLNARRSERRRLARVEPVEDLAPLAPVSLHTPLPVRRMDIDTAMSRLPERARMVYVLHDVEGYGHEEIATMMGVAAGTVRAQLHRARQLMREALRA
jgi:RNA polymerase sigma-70 factor, ECF subfamily